MHLSHLTEFFKCLRNIPVCVSVFFLKFYIFHPFCKVSLYLNFVIVSLIVENTRACTEYLFKKTLVVD